jgi:spore coat protein CotH
MKLRLAAVLLLAVVAAACAGGGAVGPTNPSGPPIAAVDTPGMTTSAPIFDPTILHDARLELDASAWKALRANYLTNQYYAANLTIDGVSVMQVGIRSRGTGSRNEEKPGLKVDMNKYVPNQEYYGYKSLILDNGVQDPTFLHERLSYRVFEAMGIAGPKNSFARLTVNGEYWGVYSIFEPISKPFLEARLGEKSGTLFDYAWASPPYDFSYLGGDSSRYVPAPFQPETNEDKADVADGLVSFVRTMNETPDAAFFSTMSSWIDVDRFLTHLAVENALAESDGIAGDQGMNNFYLYEYGAKNRFVFIPWDKDNAFRSGNWGLYHNLELNVLTRRMTADPVKRQFYAEMVTKAVTNYVNPAWLTPQLESAYQQIRAAVLEDTKKPFSNADFEGSVGNLRAVIAAREADVKAQR